MLIIVFNRQCSNQGKQELSRSLYFSKLHSKVDIILGHKLTDLDQRDVQQNKQVPIIDICIHVSTLYGVSEYEDHLCC